MTYNMFSGMLNAAQSISLYIRLDPTLILRLTCKVAMKPYCVDASGWQVSYEVTIEVKECPEDRRQWKKTFQIYPVGLTEKLTVNLELNCECECEKSSAGKVLC